MYFLGLWGISGGARLSPSMVGDAKKEDTALPLIDDKSRGRAPVPGTRVLNFNNPAKHEQLIPCHYNYLSFFIFSYHNEYI